MKKGFLITSILVILLLVIGCSNDLNNAINNTNISKVVNKTTDIVNNAINNTKGVLEDVKSEVIPPKETQEENIDSGNPSDYLIEKRVDNYKYQDSKISSVKFMTKNFNAYNAEYQYGSTKATVSVMISDDKTNIFNLLDSAVDAGDLELLDNENFDYIDNDVYFDPYKNTYIWASKDKLLMIKYSIGVDLLKKYLDKYPPSVLKGSFDNPTDVVFEDDHEEEIIYFNSNQYIIELDNWNTNEIVLIINGEERTLQNSETDVIAGLMISTNIRSDEVIIKVESEVENYKQLSMEVGVPVDVKLDKDITLEVVGANTDDLSVQVSIDGETKVVNLKQTKTISDYNVKLVNFFVSNIGEDKITIEVLVWPK